MREVLKRKGWPQLPKQQLYSYYWSNRDKQWLESYWVLHLRKESRGKQRRRKAEESGGEKSRGEGVEESRWWKVEEEQRKAKEEEIQGGGKQRKAEESRGCWGEKVKFLLCRELFLTQRYFKSSYECYKIALKSTSLDCTKIHSDS